MPIPRIEGQDGRCSARGISADGEVVVGFCTHSSGPSKSFRWEAGDLIVLEDDGGGSEVYAVSGDGRVAIGTSSGKPTFWVGATPTYLSFGSFAADGGYVRAISSDGGFALGYLRNVGLVFWDLAAGGASVEPTLLDPGSLTSVQFMSGDGLRFAGSLEDGGLGVGDRVGTTLTTAELPEPEPLSESWLAAISADGSTVVGRSAIPANVQEDVRISAVAWRRDEALPIILVRGGISERGYATSVNADGTVIAGYIEYGTIGSESFVWRNGEYAVLWGLVTSKIADLYWRFYGVAGLSADGSRLAGTVTNPDGETQAARLTLTGTGFLGF